MCALSLLQGEQLGQRKTALCSLGLFRLLACHLRSSHYATSVKQCVSYGASNAAGGETLLACASMDTHVFVGIWYGTGHRQFASVSLRMVVLQCFALGYHRQQTRLHSLSYASHVQRF